MNQILQTVGDLRVRRGARADADAVEAVRGLAPATVVTGASRGIGLALAQRFAKAGSAVLLVARDPGPLSAAVVQIRERYPRAIVVPLALDVTELWAFGRIEAELGANGLYLDVLINNAGIGLGGRFDAHQAADLDGLVALNVAAVTRLMRQALPAMQARARGGILNVASLGGVVPGPYQAAYYASKAYVLSLTEAVAAECGGSGVRIAVVAPGPVDTPFHASMGAQTAPYRKFLPSLSAERVAASTFRQFAVGRRLIVPGLFYGLSAPLLRAIPHVISVPIMRWLLRPVAPRD